MSLAHIIHMGKIELCLPRHNFYLPRASGFVVPCMYLGNSTVTELQIREFWLLFNHFVLYSYDLSQFEDFYKVQRYPCHHLKHKVLSCLETSGAYVSR